MRLFDVPEANRLVPYLDRTFREIRTLTDQARKLTQRIEKPEDATQVPELRTERDRLLARIREQLQQLEDMGVEVKSIDGLVDFRATLAGRQVYLCWRHGEESVTHWHELDTGFAGRKPIDNLAAFEPSYLS